MACAWFMNSYWWTIIGQHLRCHGIKPTPFSANSSFFSAKFLDMCSILGNIKCFFQICGRKKVFFSFLLILDAQERPFYTMALLSSYIHVLILIWSIPTEKRLAIMPYRCVKHHPLCHCRWRFFTIACTASMWAHSSAITLLCRKHYAVVYTDTMQ